MYDIWLSETISTILILIIGVVFAIYATCYRLIKRAKNHRAANKKNTENK